MHWVPLICGFARRSFTVWFVDGFSYRVICGRVVVAQSLNVQFVDGSSKKQRMGCNRRLNMHAHCRPKRLNVLLETHILRIFPGCFDFHALEKWVQSSKITSKTRQRTTSTGYPKATPKGYSKATSKGNSGATSKGYPKAVLWVVSVPVWASGFPIGLPSSVPIWRPPWGIDLDPVLRGRFETWWDPGLYGRCGISLDLDSVSVWTSFYVPVGYPLGSVFVRHTSGPMRRSCKTRSNQVPNRF
jgi:hypothetical protein